MVEPSNLGFVDRFARMDETSSAMDALTDFPVVTFTEHLRKDDVIFQHIREASGDRTHPRGGRAILAAAGMVSLPVEIVCGRGSSSCNARCLRVVLLSQTER